MLFVPPDEEALEVVIKHLHGEVGDDEGEVEIVKEYWSDAQNGYPFVGCHLFPHKPTVPQVDVDEVQILALVVAVVYREVLEELLVADVVVGR